MKLSISANALNTLETETGIDVMGELFRIITEEIAMQYRSTGTKNFTIEVEVVETNVPESDTNVD